MTEPPSSGSDERSHGEPYRYRSGTVAPPSSMQSSNAIASAARPPGSTKTLEGKKPLTTIELMFCGSVAGLIGRTATAPLERVRIMYQTNPTVQFRYKDLMETSKRIISTEGVRGLFRGNAAETFRVVPYAATSFVVFDLMSKQFSEMGFNDYQARFLGGALAGCSATTMTYPMDLVRARMAAHWSSTPLYSSQIAGYERIIRQEGVLGLYRGLTPSLLGVFPYGGILFGTFETLKASYLSSTGGTVVPSTVLVGSGVVAGIVAQVVTYPLHTVRRRIQIDGYSSTSRGTWRVLMHILRTEGVARGWMKGVSVTLIKAPVAKGLTLAGNDIIKNSIRLNEHFEDPLETNPQLPMETRQPWTKTKPQPHERKLTALERGVCGSIAGMVAKTVIAPGDRVKILYQTSAERVFSLRSAWRTGAGIVSRDGPLALWRGHSATLLRIAPYAAISYSSFDFYKEQIKLQTDIGPVGMRLLAGSMAGFTASSCTYPLDLMRARMAVSLGSQAPWSSYGELFREILMKEGPGALFRGLTPTLLGIMPYAGLSFGVFETLKAHYTGGVEGGDLPVFARLSMGAFAGLVAQTTTYPLDVVRRRFQVMGTATDAKGLPKYTSIFNCMTTIVRTEGLRGLYSGVTMNWVKGPIATAVSFTVNDLVRHRIQKYNYA